MTLGSAVNIFLINLATIYLISTKLKNKDQSKIQYFI
jgi:hypothetical protein